MLNSEQNVQGSDKTKVAQGGNDGKQKEIIRYVKISQSIEEMEVVEN